MATKKRTLSVSAVSAQEQQYRDDRKAALAWARDMVASNAYAVLDTETTGMEKPSASFRGHEVIELAIWDCDEFAHANMLIIAQEYDTIDPKAFATHGITWEMLSREGEDFPSVWNQYLRPLFDGDLDVVIFNAAFDLRMLEQTAARYGLVLPREKLAGRVHCLMEYFAAMQGTPIPAGKQHSPEQKYRWYSLTDAATYYDIPQPRSHRALADTQTTLAVLKAMASEKG